MGNNYQIRKDIKNTGFVRWWTYEQDGKYYLMANDSFMAEFGSLNSIQKFERDFIIKIDIDFSKVGKDIKHFLEKVERDREKEDIDYSHTCRYCRFYHDKLKCLFYGKTTSLGQCGDWEKTKSPQKQKEEVIHNCAHCKFAQVTQLPVDLILCSKNGRQVIGHFIEVKNICDDWEKRNDPEQDKV